jgi:hypothetical protein
VDGERWSSTAGNPSSGAEAIVRRPLSQRRSVPRATKGWSTLAKKFARSLEGFAKANYDRIVAQRKP